VLALAKSGKEKGLVASFCAMLGNARGTKEKEWEGGKLWKERIIIGWGDLGKPLSEVSLKGDGWGVQTAGKEEIIKKSLLMERI